MELAPILPSVDATMRRVLITKKINDVTGASVGLFDWDDWPIEAVTTIVES